MGYLDKVKNLKDFTSGNFITLYGRPSSGKTHLAGTFPKPLFISYKDMGLTTVKEMHGEYIEFDGTFEEHVALLHELKNAKQYHTFVFDTFGVYADSLMKQILGGKKQMTQSMWGDLGTQIKILLDLMKELSYDRFVVVSFHENTESIEGYEQELMPSVGVTASPTVRKALYGTTNYALHTFIYNHVDPKTQIATPYFALHVGTNQFYWTKFQSPTPEKVPPIMFNPTFEELYKLMSGTE